MSDTVVTDATARAARTGFAVALVGLLLDQASKLWILHGTDLPDGGEIAVTPFLDFVLVWNRGISYGLFQQESVIGRWLLVGFTVAAVIALSVWLRRADRTFTAVALGLIVGGAIGNLIDRVAYGAVVDFVYMHAFDFSWYVFNLADAWIVAGVIGLLYDSFRPDHGGAANGS
ncbi:signal peptidase II [Chthonobacter rhizosphaerae]|uniref:signal peptidase II n=1 Tax=Chthonobacter rhizosphaerae TaxID=2735553 RepID=UPI0015EE4B19|nr:signal peptidase II [Chthonobacter rhizosphaerae]